MVKLFASRIISGPMRASVVEAFRPMVRQAFEKHINGVLLDRIQGVTEMTSTPTSEVEPAVTEPVEVVDEKVNEIVTTQEELEAFFIVKAILREVVSPTRIAIRDKQSYCGILFDDNNRKPIARLHFNSAANKQFGTFDLDKNETKHKIENLNDIYAYAEELKAVVLGYLE